MSKQNFKIGKNFVPNILVLSCSAVLLLFGTLLAVSPVASHTNALVQTGEDGLSLVTNQVVDATIRPEENGSLSIIKDTVIGSTNSQYGYEIYISVNSDEVNDIYLNGNSSNDGANQKINATTGTYDTPAALDLTNGATWGYAIAGLGSFDATYDETNPAAAAKFAAMPMIDDKQLIREVSTSIADDETDIYYGIKADSTLEPGLYKTEILYTAIAKPAPRYARAILGDNNNLNFVYDSNTYTVGDAYTDNIGSTEIMAVYDVPTDSYIVFDQNLDIDTSQSNIPWISKNVSAGVNNPITSANFDQSFYDFKPTSTAYWFHCVNNLESITNIDKLNTSNVTDMSHMFTSAGENATTFDLGNLGSWDVSNVTSMMEMFSGAGTNATTWNIGDLSSWNVSSVTNMSAMFSGANFEATTWTIGNLGYVDADHPGWDVSSVTDMSFMFVSAGLNATTFDLGNLGSWDVSSVTDMSWMFGNAGFNATTWNIGNLGYVDADHPGWDVSSAITMDSMFDESGYSATTFDLGNLGSWNVSSVTSMTCMFYDAGYNATTWNIGNLGYVDADHPGWNVSNVISMMEMFSSAGSNATTWNIGDISSWDVSNVTDMTNMFSGAGANATTWNIGNLGYVDTDHPGWDVSSVLSMYSMFNSAGYSATTFDLGDLSSWDVSSVESVEEMFYESGYSATTWNIGNISGWIVTNVTDHTNFINLNTNSTNASVVNNQPGGWT